MSRQALVSIVLFASLGLGCELDASGLRGAGAGDAGTMDAASSDDAGHDAGRDAGTPPPLDAGIDAGPCGGACPECSACEGDTCVPAPAGTPCSGGTCLAGLCCNGCVSAGACTPGVDRTACGTSGGACATCTAAQSCEAGRCGTRTTAIIARAGGSHVCATNPSGALYCWGKDASGQLGDGATSMAMPTPVRAGAGTPWLAIGPGAEHTCGLLSGLLTPYCWGNNAAGQLGLGDTADRTSPTALPSGGVYIVIAAGAAHTCGVRNDLSLWCWGDNASGELGIATTEPTTVPARVGTSTGWTDVTTGWGHSCALRGSALFCWGDNTTGAVGDDTTTNATSPVAIGSSLPWRQVSAGADHTCGVTHANELYCWGDNSRGQLGDDTTTQRRVPTRIGADRPWLTVSAGRHHTCAVDLARHIACWGSNSYGQAGIDDAAISGVSSPTTLGTAADWADVAASGGFTCARKLDGRLFCWGLNDSGQLQDVAFGGRSLVPAELRVPP